MISDARGGHVSPGIYTEEQEVSYSVKSLGITNLGLAGETLKGPAFQPIKIESWTDFTDYFGGTSTEKYKGNGRPKYELPYIAKSYLSESKSLQVVRVLGLSGYKTSDAYVVAADFGGKKYPLAVFRSQISYDSTGDACSRLKAEVVKPWITSVTVEPYTGSSFDSQCVTNMESISGTDVTWPLSGTVKADEVGRKFISVDENNRELSKFAIKVNYNYHAETGKSMTVVYNVSLDANDVDYIYNVIPSSPTTNLDCPIFIESVFDAAFSQLIQDSETGTTVTLSEVTDSQTSDFREAFRCACTPWIVSEVKSASKDRIVLNKLFKFYTISDGNAANYQVKVSIQNIRPEDGLFDVVIRDFYDTDEAPVVLEKFSRCSLAEGSSNYIGLKIGTFDGGYEIKSKYVTVMINESCENLSSCVPAGFLGFPIPKYGVSNESVPMSYNTVYDVDVKAKRQYFGLNGNVLDVDVLNYKGISAYSGYDDNPAKLSNGFHLDAILNREKVLSGSSLSGASIEVDGVSGFTFSTTEPAQTDVPYSSIPRIINGTYMDNTIYSDINLRKFTVYTYGGFDGWDIYRTERTNVDKYKSTNTILATTVDASGATVVSSDSPFKYVGSGSNDTNPGIDLKLPLRAISSDYYAFLGAYNQFSNPQDIDINIFATPGIDWYNNKLLSEDALEIIEDPDDGRGGDAIYVMTCPQYDEYGNDYTEEDVVDFLDESDIDTSYGCTYFPWVKYYDKDAKIYINLPATKDVVRNMAYTDNNLYPWFAPAGTQRGNVDCVRAYKKTTLSSEDTLYDNRINPIKTFAEDGVKVWGNKTMYTHDTPLNRINARRLMIRVKKLITRVSKDLIFEQYDTTLEKQFRSLVEPILKGVQENRGISDYRVVTECTAETRDQHILPAKILIKPINALEYISITFTIYPESVAFEE